MEDEHQHKWRYYPDFLGKWVANCKCGAEQYEEEFLPSLLEEHQDDWQPLIKMYIKEREARINAEKALDHLSSIFNGPVERLSYARWLLERWLALSSPPPKEADDPFPLDEATRDFLAFRIKDEVE